MEVNNNNSNNSFQAGVPPTRSASGSFRFQNDSFRSQNMSFRSQNMSFRSTEFQHHLPRHLKPTNPINTYEITEEEIILQPEGPPPPQHHHHLHSRSQTGQFSVEPSIRSTSGGVHRAAATTRNTTTTTATLAHEPIADDTTHGDADVGGVIKKSESSGFHDLRPHTPAPGMPEQHSSDLLTSSSGADEDEGEGKEPPLPQAPHGWPALSDFPKWYWKRLTGFDQSLDVYTFAPRWDLLIALVFTATTLVVLGLIQYFVFTPLINGSLNIFLPAFGATCTCLFAVPKLPIAQPRNVMISYISAGVIGITCVNAFINLKEQPYGIHLAGAVGVGLHQLFMVFTNTLHPPASATVVSAVEASFQTYYHDRGYLFCVTPCITGSIVVILMAIILNNLVPSRSPYPQYW